MSAQLVVVDSSISDYQSFLNQISAGYAVLTLQSDTDGWQQIADYLALQATATPGQSFSTLHILSHASQGVLQLGSQSLNAGNLGAESAVLAQIQQLMAPGADLLLYGYDLAQGTEGQAFVTLLAQASGMDVAASTNLTGGAIGDWVLEAAVGSVQTQSLGLVTQDSLLTGTLITGTDGSDTLIGVTGNDTIEGLGGDDRIEVTLSGADTKAVVDGGTGVNTLSIQGGWTSLEEAFPLSLSQASVTDGNGWTFSSGASSVAFTNIFTQSATSSYWQGTAQFATRTYQLLNDASVNALVSYPEYSGDKLMVFMVEGSNNFTLINISSTFNLSTTAPYTLVGTQGNDTVKLGPGADEIATQAGNDSIIGWTGNDTIWAGDGNDTIDAGNGNASFGSDTVDGGAGTDWLVFSNLPAAITVNLASHTVTSTLGSMSITRIEKIAGSSRADSITGGDIADMTDAMGNRVTEWLRGNAGDDTITGGAGRDFYTVSDYSNNTSAQAVTANLGTGTASDGRGGTDTLVNIDFLAGGAGNDSLTGGSLSRTVSGTFYEVLRGNAGNDTLDGSNGSSDGDYASSDRADYSNNTALQAVNVNFATGLASDGLGGTDKLIAIGQVYGGLGDDTFTGSSGNDTMDGSAGNDSMDGGGGFDQVRFQLSTEAVIVNLSAESLVVGSRTIGAGTADDGMGGVDTLVNIENVQGSDFDDYFRGSDDTTVRQYFAGDGGNDTIDGGAGIDIASYGDTPLDSGGLTASLVADLSGAILVSDGKGGVDTLINIEGLSGSHSADSLTGGLGDDWLRGQGGSDTLDGGDGSDWAFYSVDPSRVIINLQTGVATDGWNGAAGVLALGGTDTLQNIENAEGSDFDDIITGSDGDNQIRGRAGNDTLDGGDGNDSLLGGAGDDVLKTASGIDTLDGGDGKDTLYAYGGNYLLTDATLTGDLSAGWTLTAGDGVVMGLIKADMTTGDWTAQAPGQLSPTVIRNIEQVQVRGVDASGEQMVLTLAMGNSATAPSLTLIGGDTAGNGYLVGTSGNDALIGGAGNDTILAGDGQDSVEGGLGDDSLDGGANDTTLGFDWVGYQNSTGAVQVDLAAGLATGADGNDTLSSFDAVAGSAFADLLTGDAAMNVLRGNLGDDTLEGGAGFDFADYSRATGSVTVSLVANTAVGFDGNDTLISIEGIRGGKAGDTLSGDANDNWIRGNGGDDTMDGGSGNDTADYYLASGGISASLVAQSMSTVMSFETGSVVGVDFEGAVSSLTSAAPPGGSGRAAMVIKGLGAQPWAGTSLDSMSAGALITQATQSVTMKVWSPTAGTVVRLKFEESADSTHSVETDAITSVAGGWQTLTFDLTKPATDTAVFNGAYKYDKAVVFFDFGKTGDGRSYYFDDLTIKAPSTSTATAGGSSGADGNDVLTSFENISGSFLFGDKLTGDESKNHLAGLGGNDTLLGAGGNDTLVGGVGNDSMDAGTGYDIVDYGQDAAGVIVDLQTQRATDGAGGQDTVVGFEEVRGSASNDVLTGSSSLYFERFEGAAGDDTIDGGAITDTLNLDNRNIASYVGASGAVTVNLEAGTSAGAAGNDVLRNINMLFGGTSADIFTGSNRTDVAEFFEGGAGDDTIDGQDGYFDIAMFTTATSGVTASLATGIATGSGTGSDILRNMEGLYGSNFADSLTGGSNSSVGTELFRGQGGNDTIDGGSGNDWSFYDTGTTGVVVTLGDTVDGSASDGQGGTDVLRSIEGVRGSAKNDTLTGSDRTDAIEYFEGREGADVIDGKGGADTAWYKNSRAGVVVDLSQGKALNDGSGSSDTLSNIENVYGSRDFNDSITGNSGDNLLEGSGGNDTLSGGAGNDTLLGGDGDDYLLAGDGNDSVVGGNGNDTLVSVRGNANLDGGAGFDTWLGDVGQNRLDGASLTGNASTGWNFVLGNGDVVGLIKPNVGTGSWTVQGTGESSVGVLSNIEILHISGLDANGAPMVLKIEMDNSLSAPNLTLLDGGTTPEGNELHGVIYDWKNHTLLENVGVMAGGSASPVEGDNAPIQFKNPTWDASGHATLEIWTHSATAFENAGFALQISGATAIKFVAGALPTTASGTSVWSVLSSVEGDVINVAGMGLGAAVTQADFKLGTVSCELGSASNLAMQLLGGDVGDVSATAYGLTASRTSTNANGEFSFSDMNPGEYDLFATRHTADIGNAITSADALATLKLAVGFNPNPDPDGAGIATALPVSPYQFMAADVVGTEGRITSADALAILKMAVKLPTAPTKEWMFVEEGRDFWDETTGTFTLNRNAAAWDHSINTTAAGEVNLVGVLKGDVNGSWSAPTGSADLDVLYPGHFDAVTHIYGMPMAQFGFANTAIGGTVVD